MPKEHVSGWHYSATLHSLDNLCPKPRNGLNPIFHSSYLLWSSAIICNNKYYGEGYLLPSDLLNGQAPAERAGDIWIKLFRSPWPHGEDTATIISYCRQVLLHQSGSGMVSFSGRRGRELSFFCRRFGLHDGALPQQVRLTISFWSKSQ